MICLVSSQVRFNSSGSCAIAFQKLLIESVLRVAMMSSYTALTSGLASLYSMKPNVDMHPPERFQAFAAVEDRGTLAGWSRSTCLHPRCSMADSLPHKFDQLGCHILRRADGGSRVGGRWLSGGVCPRNIATAVVQDHGVRAVQKLLRRRLEVGGCRVEHRQVKVGAQEAHYRVGFDDGVLGAGEFLAHARHGFSQHSLAGTHPERASCAGEKKARGVAISAAIALFGHGPTVVVGGAVAEFAVGGTNPVSVLGDLDGRPVKLGESGNQTGDHAGLAHAARVSANDDDGHK